MAVSTDYDVDVGHPFGDHLVHCNARVTQSDDDAAVLFSLESTCFGGHAAYLVHYHVFVDGRQSL